MAARLTRSANRQPAHKLIHLATQHPDRIDAMVEVAATMYFPEQARKILRTFADVGRSDEDWEARRARHKLRDDQIRTCVRS